MNQRVGRYLALAVLLGVIGAISVVTLSALGYEPEASVTKVRDAERIIGYQVFQDRGPSFRLSGTRFKLVSNVVVDKFDPFRVTLYGFRLIARDGDREVWTKDVYLQSRESKARWDGRRWLDEAAWGVDPIGLTDERIALLDIPDHAATSTLSITLLGAAREAVIRLFGEEIRTDAERQSAFRRLDPVERNELIRSSTYLPWQLLPFEEQYARLRYRWVRMAALGDSGFDVTTRMIYLTDFRLPAPSESTEGIEVTRDRDIAINVQGPARLSVAALTGTLDELEISHLGGLGLQRLGVDERGGVEVGDGPGTVIARTTRSEPMRIRVTGPAGVHVTSTKAPPALPGELAPDRPNIPLVVCGERTPIAVPVYSVSRMPLLGRGFRVDARVITTGGSDASAPTLATLSVSYVSAAGKKLRVDRVVVGGVVSRFEQVAVGGTVALVTEPSSVRVIAPPGSARIELTADRDVGIRVYRWAPAEQVVETPYRDLVVPEYRWRYARLVERSWFPITPEATAGTNIQYAQLEAQVRLEAVAESNGELGGADYDTLVPEGHPEQQRAREPVAPDAIAEVLTMWPPGSRTRLAVGGERVIEFRPNIASRPRLSWSTEASAVGSEVVVTVGDVRIPVAINSTVGAVDLPRIPTGRHRVRVEGSAAEVWIDRPPSDGGAGVARDRTLFRLTAEGLRVRVPRRGQEAVHVYAIIYSPSALASTATNFTMTIDRGKVTRRSGLSDKLTSPEVRKPMPAARRNQPAVLVDLGGKAAGLPRSIGIGILPDIVGDWHSVDLRRTGTTDVWVRFVTPRPGSRSTKKPRGSAPDLSPAMEKLSD